jgi:hypothetical protein
MEDSKHLLARVGRELLGIPRIGDRLSLLGIAKGVLWLVKEQTGEKMIRTVGVYDAGWR